MKRLVLVGLFFIFILGYFLRVMYLPQNSLTFGYDQARDATIARQILAGDLKVQGPPASQPGLFHGALYFYVLAVGYLLGNGSPIIAAYWIALVNMLTVFIVFYLSYLMTKKYTPSVLAAFLFAISFEATQYATWLSNPTIAIFTVPLMYLGLWMWLKQKNTWGVVLAALGLGFSTQAEIFLMYHAVPLAIWLWVGRKNVTKKNLITFCLVFVASISTMIANEFLTGFKSISGLAGLAAGQEANLAYAKSVGDYLNLYLNQIGRIFAFNTYPGNIGYSGGLIVVLVLSGVVYSFKQKDKFTPELFLATWLFSHLTVVTVGGTSTPFLMVGIGPAVSLVLGITLYKWFTTGYKLPAVLVLIILTFGNINTILKENPRGSTLFSIQKDMLLSKQLAAIDYSYKKANGEKFTINTLTSPLWINIVWDYLYKWEGQNKYGYLPQWHGRDQIGQLGGLPATDKDTKNYFLILEPMGGIPLQYLDLTIGEENTKSRLLEEKSFGELRIQQRIRI
ncbi:MAG: hypothetical protein AAB546_02815 [Patescibacteria group bacterium]